MEWEVFQRDHHRPHLLVLSMEVKKAPNRSTEMPDLESLAVRLGAVGNYAFKAEEKIVYAAFEDDADVGRFAEVFRAKQSARESDWASKAVATMNASTLRRVEGILRGMRLTTKRRRFSPR